MLTSFITTIAALEDNIKNPFSSNATVMDIIETVINYTFTIVGLIAVAFIIIGGFQYIMSAGNDEQAKKATSTITYAVIGLIIVFVSYAIIDLVTRAIGNK